MTMSFKDLGLMPELLQSITSLGYKIPTKIQLDVIPKILNRTDLIAVAPTGTGKTAAFALPILQLLAKDTLAKPEKHPRVLVLTPTRELAIQVCSDIDSYAENLVQKVFSIYGGVSYEPQIDALSSGVDIVVATPGRLRDHIERGNVDLSHLQILVLDEADRMLDMGFIEDVDIIISKTSKKRQTLLFSATFSDEVRALSKKYLTAPHSVNAMPQSVMAPKVSHVIHPVDPERKMELLAHLLALTPNQQTLVFTRTKVRADEVAKKLTALGFRSMATHSDRTQAYRTKAMACFKDGRIQILVATDIAARGLDIDDLGLVINYEIPNLPEDYVHRIGRTGRAGSEGKAISLITQDELYLLAPIEQLIKKTIPQIWVDGFAPLHFDPRRTLKKHPTQSHKPRKRKWGK